MEEASCGRGHRLSLYIPTQDDAGICLQCFTNLLEESSAFIIHKCYAISEFTKYLDDELFRQSLVNHQPHFVVGSLAKTLWSCKDEQMARAIMDLILRLCALAMDESREILNDFIIHISLDLGSELLVSNRGQCYTLHVFGLLLDIHSKYDCSLPHTLKSEREFFVNLVSGLQLPGCNIFLFSAYLVSSMIMGSTEGIFIVIFREEIKGEILFVFYKVSCLQGGAPELLRFCPQIIHLTVNTLLKTQSDELRTNCIAFLTVMAQNSAFVISLPNSDGIRSADANKQSFTQSEAELDHDLCFTRMFAEAIKGALLSPDRHLQVATMRLIRHVCSEEADGQHRINILLEEGIVDYIFEVLRGSESSSNLVGDAVPVLSILSAARDFPNHACFGLDALVDILQHSMEVAFYPVQDSLLRLLSSLFSNCPGIIDVKKADQMLRLLAKLVQNQANTTEDLQLSGGCSDLSPDNFIAACFTITALLQVPSCANIQSLPDMLLTVANNVLICLSYGSLILHPGVLKLSAHVLREAYVLCQSKWEFAKSLWDLFRGKFLSAFIANLDKLDDEETVEAVFITCTLFLQCPHEKVSLEFAENLVSSSWISLSMTVNARFYSQEIRKAISQFLGALVGSMLGITIGKIVENTLLDQCLVPTDMIMLLEQHNVCNTELASSQSAVVAILYMSYIYNDRIVEDVHILASLEHFLLLNSSLFTACTTSMITLSYFIILYILVREQCEKFCASHNTEAERLFLEILQQCNWESLISPATPKSVLVWIFQKESLYPVSLMHVYSSFFVNNESCTRYNHGQIVSERQETEDADADTRFLCCLLEESSSAAIFVCLLQNASENMVVNDMAKISIALTQALKHCPYIASNLLKHGIIKVMRRWLILYSLQASFKNFISGLELIFYLISSASSPQDFIYDNLWLDISNKVCLIVLYTENKEDHPQLIITALCILCMILCKSFHTGLLGQASHGICSNKELCNLVKLHILNMSEDAIKLSQINIVSMEERIFCACFLFYLLRLLWFRRSEQKPSTSKAIGVSAEHEAFPASDILQCSHLCHILHYGSEFLRDIASCCLELIFSQLHDNNSITELDFRDAASILLMGSLLDECGLVQVNAASCLISLMKSDFIYGKEREINKKSSWYCFLMEELMRSLVHPQNVGILQRRRINSLCSVAEELLKVMPLPEWMTSLFSPANLASVTSNVALDSLSFEVICFFLQLLRSGYLKHEHVQRLCPLLQTLKIITYKNGTLLSQQEESKAYPNYSLDAFSDPSDVLAATYDATLRQYTSGLCLNVNSESILRIDEFLQESCKV